VEEKESSVIQRHRRLLKNLSFSRMYEYVEDIFSAVVGQGIRMHLPYF
jgi:hypothetical protein